MTHWPGELVESMGYAGVVLLMFAENVLPPIPSELIMPLAGFLAGQGKLNLAGVIVAGTAGSVLGAMPLYGLGWWLGQERLCRWSGRWGHWVAVSPDDIRRSAVWFRRHGGKAVLLCRLIPGVRSLVSIPAGTARMPLVPFLAYTAVGAGAWTATLAWLGRALGQNYDRVQHYLGPVTYVVMAALLVAFVVRAVKLNRARSRGAGSDEAACAAAAPVSEKSRPGGVRKDPAGAQAYRD